jgi:hypothetical protein
MTTVEIEEHKVRPKSKRICRTWRVELIIWATLILALTSLMYAIAGPFVLFYAGPHVGDNTMNGRLIMFNLSLARYTVHAYPACRCTKIGYGPTDIHPFSTVSLPISINTSNLPKSQATAQVVVFLQNGAHVQEQVASIRIDR